MTTNTDNIDFFELFLKIYNNRKRIIIITFIFGIIGVFAALITPEKYNSKTIFISQNFDGKNNSSLSGVASLVGINLSGALPGGEIPTSMYPHVAESTKFKRMLLNSILDFNSGLSVKSHLIKYYNIKIDSTLNNYQDIDNIYVSKSEEEIFDILTEIISVEVDPKDGFISIEAISNIPQYAAVLANNSKNILQEIIIKNKIESAKQNLKFTQEQLEEKKLEFEELQTKLSFFKDSNLNLVNSTSISEQDKLEAEFQIINSVVTELSKQVEQAKLQVKKDTPVFSTIKTAVIPNLRLSPKRTQMVLIYGFVGFVFICSFYLIKDSVLEFLKKINKD